MARKAREICIVGAGPGGLASAMLLATTGARVRVIERLPRVGGRCSAMEVDGFRFDIGPTFFLYPRVLEEIFSQVGRDLWSEIPMTRLDPQYRLVFGEGGQIDATPDIAAMESEIAKLAPSDAAGFRRFMTENRAKLAKFRPILESPFGSALDLMRPELLKAVPHLRPWLSVAGDLQSYFKDPRLLTAFSFQSKYLGMSPFQCPSLFTILAYLEYEYGVFHPQGGCSAVSEKMAEIAGELGVEIHLEESVESLRFEGKRVVGVETDRGDYSCDALVINADFSRAMQRLVPDRLRRSWSDRRIKRAKYSCSTFMMYLGIEGRYDDTPHHTIYISGDYRQNLRDIESGQRLTEDTSFYVQNAGVTDPTLAPPGMSTLYVLVPVSNQQHQLHWPTLIEPFRRNVLKQLARVGLEDVESRICCERIITPDDWDQSFEIHRGATFNLSHNLGQMLHRRPRNRFNDLDGVYLVGGGTHPGSGLPVIYESARISSRLLCEDLNLDLKSIPAAPRRLRRVAA